MTLREADEAGMRCVPVESGGIGYVRIIEIGFKYDDKGHRVPFVRLLDKCGHSITTADPERTKIFNQEESDG